jgi:hypothetical protein
MGELRRVPSHQDSYTTVDTIRMHLSSSTVPIEMPNLAPSLKCCGIRTF